MIDGSEKRNHQLAIELQNSHVCEKCSNVINFLQNSHYLFCCSLFAEQLKILPQ